MSRRSSLILLSILALPSCVMQSTFDALQKDYDDTKETLARRDSENSSLKSSLQKEQDKARQLNEQSTELDKQIAKLQSDLQAAIIARGALEAEKSAVLKDKSSLEASVDEMRHALADLAKRKAEADARISEFRSLLDRFKSLIDAGKLKIKMADGRMVVELASDVLFASGSSNLSRDGKAAVSEVATLLADIPGRKFQIEGHTDNVPMRSDKYPSNWELAAARAITVLKTMLDAGLPPERISAASYGDSKPAKDNETPEGKAANRRIEIVVVPDLSSLPGFDELNRAAAQ